MWVMRIMPRTWAELRARYGLGADPYNPHDNILAGAACIRELHDRYGSPGFVGAYNAGPRRYWRRGLTATGETQAYIATLAPMIEVNRLTAKLPPSRSRSLGPARRYSPCAPRATQRSIGCRVACVQIIH
jgi:soluble lytic murein transglycosylase-like protein